MIRGERHHYYSIMSIARIVKTNQIPTLTSGLNAPLWGFGGDVGSERWIIEISFEIIQVKWTKNCFKKIKMINLLTVSHIFVTHTPPTYTLINCYIMTMVDKFMLGTFHWFSWCHFAASPPVLFGNILVNYILGYNIKTLSSVRLLFNSILSLKWIDVENE